MKRTIIYLFAAVALSSACSDEREINPYTQDDDIIRFAVSTASSSGWLRSDGKEMYGDEGFFVEVSPLDGGIQTRGALVDSVADLDEFGVYAYQTATAFSYSAAATKLMENTRVAIDHTNAEACSYAPTRFWPTTTDHLTFMAYAPYLSVNTTNDHGLLLSEAASSNNLTIAYTVPVEASKQPDLMVADLQKDKTTAANGTAKVPANFQHALAAVGFKIRGNNLKLKQVSISNVLNKGTLTCYEESTDRFSWATEATTATFNAGISPDTGKDYATLGVGYVDVTAGNGYLMMIPQTVTQDMTLTISYEKEDGTPEIGTYQLSKAQIQAWEAGKKYMYNVTITPFFSIEVTPVNFNYLGEQRTYTVVSRYIPKGGTGEVFTPWELVSTPPSWLTLTTTSASSGSVEATYTTTATSQLNNPSAISRDDRIKQATPVSDKNLAADGETANCYLVNAAGTYSFPANVMGVGDSGVDPTYARNYLGQAIGTANIPTTNAYAKLVWQTEKGLIQRIELKGNDIHFETASQADIKQGSALIAIMNKGEDRVEGGTDDKIMWSWHIWVTDISLEKDPVTFDFPGNTHTILPYQLGFENEGKSYPKRSTTLVFKQTVAGGDTVSVDFTQDPFDDYLNYICTYYKWGRKDPFVADASTFANGKRNLYDIDGNVVSTNYVTSFDPNRNYSITTPLAFEITSGGNWSSLLGSYPDVWGNEMEKSIYDPSPAGFRIPRRGDLNALSRQSYKVTKGLGYSIMNISEDGTRTMNVASCGGIYGRDNIRGLYCYGGNTDFNYVWLSSPAQASVPYNRWAFFMVIKSQPAGENYGQSSCQALWVMPLKYK